MAELVQIKTLRVAMEIVRNKMLRAFFTKHFDLCMLELLRRIPLKPRKIKQI
ncbi:hypothetical protein D3C81_1103200 [compost metagenome]